MLSAITDGDGPYICDMSICANECDFINFIQGMFLKFNKIYGILGLKHA